MVMKLQMWFLMEKLDESYIHSFNLSPILVTPFEKNQYTILSNVFTVKTKLSTGIIRKKTKKQQIYKDYSIQNWREKTPHTTNKFTIESFHVMRKDNQCNVPGVAAQSQF